MRQVSLEDGGPRKPSVAMEQPATTNSIPTKRTPTPTAEITAVPLLQALLYRQRDELATERAAVKALQRARASEIKAVREEEAAKCRNLLSDLKSRLDRDHEDALQRQKDAITKTLNSEMLRALKEKDVELRRQLAEARERGGLLKLQIREAVRAGRDVNGCQHSGACSGKIQKLQEEAAALRLQSKQLEERLQMVVQADRQKMCDLKSLQAEKERQLEQLRKTWQQETHKLLEEIKSKDRAVSQLEQQLHMQKGRMQERGQQWAGTKDDRRQQEQCEVEKVNCGEVLPEHLEFQQTGMKKAVEMEEVADRGGHVDELETLRAELEERDRIIAELQQGERLQVKDRKSDHLSNRHRKEQMRQYYRHFMELEPVAELEEDSGAGEDSPTSSNSPSLSPQPYTADMWAELPDRQYHDTLYSCLLKEHLELQREYQFLQNRLKGVLGEPNRTRLKMEHELATALTHVRKLKRLLAEQEGSAAVLTDTISQLQAETQDLREQNELLEFRILELEECHENSSVRSHWPDTRDVWTDTESDDVSDSGVHSLPSSDSDAGIHDMKMEILSEELKGRLQDLIEATPNTSERNCLQKVLVLLENWECRPQDSATAHERSPRSPSQSNRIIATVLPFTDKCVDGEGDNIKKHLKNSECLQESGIFEETEYTSQGTQTGDFNLEAFICDIRMPFEDGVVGELSAEIQRLNQFRERVEEAGHCCGSKRLLRVDDDVPSQTKELDFCRQRLQLLEDKVLIYESSGDQQARLLAERLQREISLSAQVKELSAKVQHLISEKRCLEEEKCELEEAENDTRLRCQKLEVKLVTLNESRADLEVQLQQERRTLGRLRSALAKGEREEEESRRQLNYLEVVLNKYEQRNYDLEEREVDLRHRLEMLESSIQALVIWNMWQIVQNNIISRTDTTLPAMSRCLVKVTDAEHRGGGEGRPNTSLESSVTFCHPLPSTFDSSRYQDVVEQGPRVGKDLIGSEEVIRLIEGRLQVKLQDLEAEVVLLNTEIKNCKESEDKYIKRISELEGELDDLKSSSEIDGSRVIYNAAEAESNQNAVTDVQPGMCTNFECTTKAQEFVYTEANMKKRIVELENKEKAYMETLQRADELWTDMETSYKRKISNAEDKENAMRETIRKLQENEMKLRQSLRQDEENELLLEKIQNMEGKEKMLGERFRSLEAEKNQLTEEINHLRETLQSEQKELENTKEMARPLKEELMKERRMSRSLQEEIKTVERDSQNRSRDQQAQINGLKVQLKKMSRDLVDLECTNGELKEEVETLEAKVCELKAVIEEQKQSEEKLAIKMSQTIQQREQELEEIKREMRFSLTPTAHDELREVDKDVAGTDAALKPVESKLSDVQNSQAEKDPPQTPAANVQVPGLTSQAPGTAKKVTQQPSETPPTRERGCKCSLGVDQPPPVSTLSQKPVLRRWLLSQTLQRQDCGHWRQC